MSPRIMMQTVGTDLVRRGISDDFWIKRANSQLITSTSDLFIITDVRFENEAQFIRDQGGTVYHIIRDGINDVNTHSSEDGVTMHFGDIAIENNGSFDDLRRRALYIV